MIKNIDPIEKCVQINTEGLPPGIYTWKAKFQGQSTENGEIVIVK